MMTRMVQTVELEAVELVAVELAVEPVLEAVGVLLVDLLSQCGCKH